MQRIAVSLCLLFWGMQSFASPKLQMHVFDQEQSDSKIQMHIFTNRAQTYKRPRYYPSQNKPTNPTLAYQKAAVYFRTGYRKGDLFFNIAGINRSPNIISELTWEDLEIITLDTGASFQLHQNWLLNLDLSYGRIFDGENQDSDYLGDNRTMEFSRSYADSDDGDVYDISISAAYRYPINQSLELQPELGLSYHAQNLTMTHGVQVVSAFGHGTPLGPFGGLNSTYDSTWFGPWFGLSLLAETSDKLSLNFGLEYHYAYYDSTADWNLRGDFAHPESFTNETKGYGLVGRIEGLYKYSPNLTLDFALNYQHWQSSESGAITFFLADNTSAKQPFNEVEWRSYGFSLGLNYDF